MNTLENYIANTNRCIRNDSVLKKLRSCELRTEQFNMFAAQRASLPFLRLLQQGNETSKKLGDLELTEALESNLNDELGIDKNGKIKGELSHKVWKMNYLEALNLNPKEKKLPLLQSVKKNIDTFISLEEEGNVFHIAGVILCLENIIPIEYSAAIVSRNHLFPEIFCINSNDLPDVIRAKKKAAIYMDDHIIHDSKSHFPDLLKALIKYETTPNTMNQIKRGISIASKLRKQFYEELYSALDFGQDLIRYYTIA